MFRLISDVIPYVALFALLLFLPAQTLAWPRAWFLLFVLFVARTLGVITIFRKNPAILHERRKFPLQMGQRLADKILLVSFMACFAAVVAFISFDVWRLHLFPRPALQVSAAGIVLFALGWWVVTLALKTNPFAIAVVRYQEERNHSVVSEGIYRIVRHPMYAGLVLIMIGMCLWLESFASALASIIPIGILILRIRLEEQLLMQQLDGYRAYAGKVRWRIIPGLW